MRDMSVANQLVIGYLLSLLCSISTIFAKSGIFLGAWLFGNFAIPAGGKIRFWDPALATGEIFLPSKKWSSKRSCFILFCF